MKLLEGGVRGVDCETFDLVSTGRDGKDERTLPLDESVHAHEGGELLWNQRESTIGEDLCIPGHYFRQRRGRLRWPGLIKKHMNGRKIRTDDILAS